MLHQPRSQLHPSSFKAQRLKTKIKKIKNGLRMHAPDSNRWLPMQTTSIILLLNKIVANYFMYWPQIVILYLMALIQ